MFGNIKYPLWFEVDYIPISVYSHILLNHNRLKLNGGSSIFFPVKQIKCYKSRCKRMLTKINKLTVCNYYIYIVKRLMLAQEIKDVELLLYVGKFYHNLAKRLDTLL